MASCIMQIYLKYFTIHVDEGALHILQSMFMCLLELIFDNAADDISFAYFLGSLNKNKNITNMT